MPEYFIHKPNVWKEFYNITNNCVNILVFNLSEYPYIISGLKDEEWQFSLSRFLKINEFDEQKLSSKSRWVFSIKFINSDETITL